MPEKRTRRSNAERSQRTRGALLTAARQLFVEKGYAETSTPEIARAASVSRGALYHHFDDKKSLFDAVVHAEAHRIAAVIESRASGDVDPLDALLLGADAYFDAMTAPGRTTLMLLDGPAVLGVARMAELDAETGGASLREGLQQLISRTKADLPVDALAASLSAAFDRAALGIAEGASAEPFREALKAVLRGLATPAR